MNNFNAVIELDILLRIDFPKTQMQCYRLRYCKHAFLRLVDARIVNLSYSNLSNVYLMWQLEDRRIISFPFHVKERKDVCKLR